MAFTTRTWSKGNIVKPEDLNRFEQAFVTNDKDLTDLEQLKATKTELAATLAPKADKTYVDAQDALLATKTELTEALAPKADKTYVDAQAALKADKTYVDAQDALKATKTELTNAASPKADKTYVDTQDALKATKTELTNALEPKADKTYVDMKNALKADKTYVDQQDALKASKTELTNALSPKADKTYVDQQDALKATKAELTNALAPKADKTYVDGQLATINGQLSESARETQVLQQGVNILNADVATPVDFEVQGRTLTSLANSNLEALKYYALADKKSKIIVDGVTVAGIGKFQKKSTTLTTADFTGKVAGSTTANPHIAYRGARNTLEIISAYQTEFHQSQYDLTKVNDNSIFRYETLIQGTQAQHVFSFNIIEQVERQLGLIPKTTAAEKVQWIKDNVSRLTANWHGFGSGPAGNKAEFAYWRSSTSAWTVSQSHTSGSVSKIGLHTSDAALISILPDANGLIHFLAYTEASDGVTASTINTDFINLEIELKTNVQLNTRGKIIKVENFEGKVSGSVVENPHIMRSAASVSLASPGAGGEITDTDKVAKLDGTIRSSGNSGTGNIVQQIFSFNIIEAVERNIGKIPAADITGKVSWLNANIEKFMSYWHGFGAGPTGNKASLSLFYAQNGTWSAYKETHAYGTVQRLGMGNMTFPYPVSSCIDASGFVHFLAYAEPSDGTTASTINTDYIELEIELKATANFSNPKVPLYEVTKEDYDKIGVTWTEQDTLNRFPIVEGTQHLLNPYIMAEGENLLPPFSEWVLHGNAKIISPYELEINPTNGYQASEYTVSVIPNTTYRIAMEQGVSAYSYSYQFDSNQVRISNDVIYTTINGQTGGVFERTFTTGPNTRFLKIQALNNHLTTQTSIKNFILSVGTAVKPFTPRNPSYLYTDTKLGAIGAAKDVVFRQDGQWKRRKVVEKDVLMDGSHLWASSNQTDLLDFKRAYAPTVKQSQFLKREHFSLTSSEGKEIKFKSTYQSQLEGAEVTESGFFIQLPDSITGFQKGFNHGGTDFRRYFNGWKYTDGTTWISVTGNGQTATAQVALDTKPTDYTPYKLSYVLATPVIENVEVEGDIIADGLTQTETGTGVIVREKVTPVISGGNYYIGTTSGPVNPFKNKASKIIGIYSNGVEDTKFQKLFLGVPYGKLAQSDFDATAEYTVTYLALDKQKLTVNPVDTKAVFARNIRSSHDDLAIRASDNTTLLSVHEQAIVDLYVRLKALEVK